MPSDAPSLPNAVLDAALAAWFASLERIGGLTERQQARYRRAMDAAFKAAGVGVAVSNSDCPEVQLQRSEA